MISLTLNMKDENWQELNNMSMQKYLNHNREIAEGKNYYLKFSCGNSICDINNDIIESAEEADINLGLYLD